MYFLNIFIWLVVKYGTLVFSSLIFYFWCNLHTLIVRWRQRWLGFLDLWSSQKPWWNWYLTLVVNFSEVWRAQLVIPTVLTSTLVPWDLFRSFKVYSDTKERVGCWKQWKLLHLFIPGETAVLAPEFAVEDLPLQNCSLGSCTCSEGPAFGQSTLMMMMMMIIIRLFFLSKKVRVNMVFFNIHFTWTCISHVVLPYCQQMKSSFPLNKIVQLAMERPKRTQHTVGIQT